MPLAGYNQIQIESLSILPSNASNVAIVWAVEDGYIESGQGTDNLYYKWDLVNGPPVQRTVSVLAQNDCSTRTFSKTYTVCDEIIGAYIDGPKSIVQSTNSTYILSAQYGWPINIVWSIVGSSSAGGSIVSSNGNEVTIVGDLIYQNLSGQITLIAQYSDYDGNVRTLDRIISIQSNCVPITSISF